jgi:hypothetical protein
MERRAMMQYTEKTDDFGNKFVEAIDGDSVIYIPANPANADYQAYLNKDNPDYGKQL